MNVIISDLVSMLQALLFSLITTSSAFTTHRYDSYDSFGNYRPSATLLDNIFGYENSNGRAPMQAYGYTKRYNGLVNSDVYQGVGEGENRRIDKHYSYQNPHQWNRVAVTEPAKFLNRFENSNQDRKYVYNSDTRYGQQVVQQGKEKGTDQRKLTNELNKTQGNASVPQITTQSNDVNRTLVITEQQITWNSEHHDSSDDNNTNINTRSINSVQRFTNSLNVPDKQNADKTKTDDGDSYDTSDGRNKTATKTSQDNEVTLRPLEPRTKPYEDDKWIWSNGDEQKVETTTLFNLGDRAAFSGNGCPVGMAKLGNSCVVID